MSPDVRADGSSISGRAAIIAMLVTSVVLAATGMAVLPDRAFSLLAADSPSRFALVYALVFAPLAIIGVACAWFAARSGLRAGRAAGRQSLWLVGGAAALAVAVGIAALSGGLVPGGNPGAALPALLIGLVAIGFQATAEEIFFRGWLQAAMLRMAGPALAIGISSLAFMAVHLSGGERSGLSLFNLALGGLWFGLLAWRSGGLVAPVAAHLGWNASEDLLFGLVPNPGVGAFGAWIDLDIAGRSWWGGSDEGLNASIAMTGVLVALIVPLLWPRGRSSAGGVIPPAATVPHPPGHAA